MARREAPPPPQREREGKQRGYRAERESALRFPPRPQGKQEPRTNLRTDKTQETRKKRKTSQKRGKKDKGLVMAGRRRSAMTTQSLSNAVVNLFGLSVVRPCTLLPSPIGRPTLSLLIDARVGDGAYVAPGHPGRPPLALGEGRAPGRGRSNGQGTPARRGRGRGLGGGGASGVLATALPLVTDGQVLGAVVVVPFPRLGHGGGRAGGRGQRDERGHQQGGLGRGGAPHAAPPGPGDPVGAEADGGRGRVWKGKSSDSDESTLFTLKRVSHTHTLTLTLTLLLTPQNLKTQIPHDRYL